MDENKVIIIAEAGVNHNGNFELAKKLIKEAKKAGADYVKFQTAIPELVISKFAPKAEYQKESTSKDESQLDMCKSIHLSITDYRPLKEYCDKIGIKFLSTPFDLVSIDVLADLSMDCFKIPSGEITNLPYLRKISKIGSPVILSTGMCTIADIENALNIMYDGGLTDNQITILHCNTEYPTPMQDVNLKAMETIRTAFGVNVGYSDHTLGIEVPIAAVALGAKVIEKHFTLNRTMKGPDHKASLEPNELKQMIDSIRNIELALGRGIKHVSASERKNMDIARKSIIALKAIKKGELFNEENLTTKRPGTGISPMQWDMVIGRIAKKDFEKDELIEL
jgi:N,N'-diacetyllegionaminate synthase